MTTAAKGGFGYTRVYAAAQAAGDRVSLDEQRKDIEVYCKSNGYDVGSTHSLLASLRRSYSTTTSTRWHMLLPMP